MEFRGASQHQFLQQRSCELSVAFMPFKFNERCKSTNCCLSVGVIATFDWLFSIYERPNNLRSSVPPSTALDVFWLENAKLRRAFLPIPVWPWGNRKEAFKVWPPRRWGFYFLKQILVWGTRGWVETQGGCHLRSLVVSWNELWGRASWKELSNEPRFVVWIIVGRRLPERASLFLCSTCTV